MKRLHVHLAVDDLQKNIRFYSRLFGAEPAVVKPDYAKWMLDDPRVNFAVSTRGRKPGLDHLGIQVEDDAELQRVHQDLERADAASVVAENASCCYARSHKYWVQDPQGVPWEAFHSLESIPVFSERDSARPAAACCAPK